MRHIPITDRQKNRLSRLMVRVQKIVERVTILEHGKYKVNQFRRDLPTGRYDKYLTSRERTLIRLLQAHEGEVVLGFYAYANLFANKFKAHSPEDLVQIACESVFMSMYGYKGKVALSSYFCNVIKNSIFDSIKSQRTRKRSIPTIHEVEFHDIYQEELGEGEFTQEDLEMAQEVLESTPLTVFERMCVEYVIEKGRGALVLAAKEFFVEEENPSKKRQVALDAFRRGIKKIKAQFIKNTKLARTAA